MIESRATAALTTAPEVTTFLRLVRRRWLAARVASASARGLATAALVLLGGTGASRAVASHVTALAVVAAATVAASVAAFAWAVLPLVRRRATDRQVARFTEDRVPELEDRLATAAAVLEGEPGWTGSEGCARLVLADAAEAVKRVAPDAVVPRRALERAVGRAGLAAMLFAVSVATAVGPARRAVETIVGSGGDGRATGDTPAERAVAQPPRVIRIDVEYEFPAHTGLRPRRELESGDIFAPEGTRVRLVIQVDRPVVRGVLALAEGDRVSLESRGPQQLAGTLRVERDGSYRIALETPDGRRHDGETEYFIRVVDDRPPVVRILRPAGDRRVTPLEEVGIEAQAEDDYGIAGLELVYAVNGGEPHAVVLGRGGTAPAHTGSYLLFLEDLGVRPGDFIAYYARARDVGRFRRPAEARSDMYFLEVVPFEEEFVAAESAALGGLTQRSLESLIRAQKDIVSATWALERRAPAGRSAVDVRRVAGAQAEVKRQVESMRGRAPVAPPRSEGAPGRDGERGDPLAGAAEAMARAQAALEATETGRALPHEMEALAHLMRAEAEIRRRQVARQQQAGGGGGQGRQQYDLSALFDRELQRQQRSSYEARPPAATGDRERADEALRAIEDLARRQDDVSRQLDELARRTLDQTERRRQLERLAREQESLERQADALARRLARERAADARDSGRGEGRAQGTFVPGAVGQDEEASRQARAAAGEMERATRELREGDLDEARARSARAAAELDELARAVRAARPDEARRALGDLGLDARQLAEAAGRAAAEARRLADTSPDAARAEATRRLAGEEERLAGRIERLQQALGRVAAAAPGSPTAEMRDALARERLAERLRAEAAARRAGAGPPAGERGMGEPPAGAGARAGAAEAAARTLERVARTLDEAARRPVDADAADLAARLERARELRERLDALGRALEEGGRGAQARRGAPGGAGEAERDRLARELTRVQREARALLDRMPVSRDNAGRGLTPETHEYTMGAPALEAFKQDFSSWEALRRDVAAALERYELEASAELARRLGAGRVRGDDVPADIPEAYRALVARYYVSLAKKRP